MIPVLRSMRSDVNASRESRLQRSTVDGELAVVVHYPTRQVFDQLLADHACWLVSSATVFAIASITSSASPVSTLPEPACPIPQSWSQEPVHVGGGCRNYSRAGETVARSAPGAHAAARSCFSVSAADTFTSVHRFKGSIPQ